VSYCTKYLRYIVINVNIDILHNVDKNYIYT